MRHPRALATLAAITGLVALGDARSLHAQHALSPGGRFVVGGGVDLLTGEHGARTPGAILPGGYGDAIARSRVSLRVEVGWWSRGTRFDGVSDGAAVRDVARIRTVWGAGSLGLDRFAPRSRVRRYALGGVGVQQVSVRNETTGFSSGEASGRASWATGLSCASTAWPTRPTSGSTCRSADGASSSRRGRRCCLQPPGATKSATSARC